jgi:hypothetical protein
MPFDFSKSYDTWSQRQKARALDLLVGQYRNLDIEHPQVHSLGRDIASNVESIPFSRWVEECDARIKQERCEKTERRRGRK